jgi:hypothetical protein
VYNFPLFNTLGNKNLINRLNAVAFKATTQTYPKVLLLVFMFVAIRGASVSGSLQYYFCVAMVVVVLHKPMAQSIQS